MLETSVCLGFARNTGDILPLNQRLFLCAMSALTLETVWPLNEVGIGLTGKRGGMLRREQTKKLSDKTLANSETVCSQKLGEFLAVPKADD